MAQATEIIEWTGAAEGPETASLYDRDFHAWTVQQAQAVRAGRSAELDMDNLAEEIEDLGRRQFDKLQSAFQIVLLHMLKWDHQSGKRSRSWTISVANGRIDLENVILANPSLRPRRWKAVEQGFRKARLEAADETGLKLRAFPTECPYSLDEILDRPFEWPED